MSEFIPLKAQISHWETTSNEKKLMFYEHNLFYSFLKNALIKFWSCDMKEIHISHATCNYH